MATLWSITMQKGSQYSQTITINGVADISTATGWSVKIGVPGSAPILEATTANGMIAGLAANSKNLTISAEDTDALAVGNYRFDFDISWADKTIRYYALGQCLVQPKVGA